MTTDDSSGPRTKFLLALIAGIACAASGRSQTLIPGLSSGGGMRLLQTDLAVLESQEPRRDLPCIVTTPKPELGFDFLFHTGYEVEVPISELAGDGDTLTVLFRVVPQDHPDEPSYMVQKVPVPVIAERAGGAGTFYGNFTLGEGKYHVDWLMRDRGDRVCAASWDLETKLNPKDVQLRQWIPQALVQAPGAPIAEEPLVKREPGKSLPRFSIIVNLDPPDPSAALIDEQGLHGLLAILRQMDRDPRIEPYSIILCSLETQQVIYQQESRSSIDLPAVEEALASAKIGTVDAKRLVSTNGPAQFAADLVRGQLSNANSDVLVVLGPKRGSEVGLSRQALESFDKPGKPAFYLSYDTRQSLGMWRDPISSIMKRLRGFEYRITRPKDVFNAWSDIISRIIQARQGPPAQMSTAAIR